MFPRNRRIIIVTLLGIGVITCLILFTWIQKPNYSTKIIEEADLLNINHLLTPLPEKLLNISCRYVLNNESLCGNKTEEILAVFIVTSYFGNIETRSAMRRAFSSKLLEKNKLRRVFLLGEAPKDQYTSQNIITNESNRFNDIIEGNFTEAYRNLTYKHVMGLKWATKYCINAKYIIKMDDDIVVNMYNVNKILDSLKKLSRKDFIAGYVLRKMNPIREPTNKWYVTNEEYPSNKYPSFISGWFYITNPETARKIVALSNYAKYFWIDDVFVTGILAKNLKIIQYDISQYFTEHAEFLQCCLQDFEKNVSCDITVGPNGGNNNLFFEFNEKVKMCAVNNCKQRERRISDTCVAERKVNLGRGNAVISDFKLH